MKYLKYFFSPRVIIVCPVIALFLSAALSFILKRTPELICEFILPMFCLIFAIRTNDDMWDYEKDKEIGKSFQPPCSIVPGIAAVISLAVFAAYNVAFYGIWGAVSVFFAIYILVWEIFPFIKPFFALFMYFYYCTMHPVISFAGFTCGCLFFLVFPLIYYFLKKDLKKQN